MNVAAFSSTNELEALLDVRVLWALRHQWRTGMSLRSEPVGDCVLWIVTDGEVSVQLEKAHWNIGQGQWFMAPPGQTRTVSVSSHATWLSICLRARILEHTDVLHLANPPLKISPPPFEFEELQQISTMLAREWSGTGEVITAQPYAMETFHQRLERTSINYNDSQTLLQRSLGEALFALLWRNITQHMQVPLALHHGAYNFPDWLMRVLDDARRQTCLSVEDMARRAGFSASRFRALFVNQMGISPRDYLQRTRLEQARRLVETTDLPIAHIATQTGFASAAHFTHQFRNAFGATPRDYRKLKHRQGV